MYFGSMQKNCEGYRFFRVNGRFFVPIRKKQRASPFQKSALPKRFIKKGMLQKLICNILFVCRDIGSHRRMSNNEYREKRRPRGVLEGPRSESDKLEFVLFFREIGVHCNLKFIVRERFLYISDNFIAHSPAILCVKADHKIEAHCFLILQ